MVKVHRVAAPLALLQSIFDNPVTSTIQQDNRLGIHVHSNVAYIPTANDYATLKQITPNRDTTPEEWEQMKNNARAIEEVYRLHGKNVIFGDSEDGRYKTFPIYLQAQKVIQADYPYEAMHNIGLARSVFGKPPDEIWNQDIKPPEKFTQKRKRRSGKRRRTRRRTRSRR
tara:strand:+ start:97 stop:606 length:510 start_codon:yes stop_codon:yes gene_type:complete